MRLAPFDERVLSRVMTDARLGAYDLDSVRSCVRAGMSLEQALVGLGVIDLDAYRHALSAASGLSCADGPVRLDERFFDLEAYLVDESPRHVALAFVRPDLSRLREASRRAREAGQALLPFVTDRISVRGARRPDHAAVDEIIQALIQAADEVRSSHVRLVLDGGRVHAFSESGSAFTLEIPGSCLPAMRLRLKKRAPSGWRFDSPLPTAAHLSRAGEWAHPAGWSRAVQAFLRAPSGLLVVTDSDPSLLRQLAAGTVPLEDSGSWRDAFSSSRVACCPADTAAGRELALQTALAGRPVIAVGRGEGDWWSPASEAGIPVHVVRSTVTPRGRAWSAHRIRI